MAGAPEEGTGENVTESGARIPRWVRVADVAVVLLLATALGIAVVGGGVTTLFGIRIILKSTVRPLVAATLLLAVRLAVSRVRSPAEWLRQASEPFTALGRRLWSLDVMPTFLATRLGVLLFGYLAVAVFGYPGGAPPFRYTHNELLDLPVRWDTGWYLSIVTDGYRWVAGSAVQTNLAFFPAYPMAVRAAGLFQLGRGDETTAVWLGVGVSLAAFLGALVYLHRLARRFADRETATTSAVLLAAYPFAVFFSAAYTESLFLLATLGAFHHLASRQPGRAAAWGLLSGLTRPNGVFLAVPLALMAFDQSRAKRHRPGATADGGRRLLGPGALALAAAVAPVAGMLLFSSVVWYHTGNPFEWAVVQRAGWSRQFGAEALGGPLEGLTALGPAAFMQAWPIDSFNMAGTIMALACVWPVTRRLGAPYGAFVIINTLVPLLNGGLLSMGRLTSVLFPMFIWLALALPERLRPGVVFVFAGTQAIVAAMFFTWRPLF